MSQTSHPRSFHDFIPQAQKLLPSTQACRDYYELTRLHKFPLGNILLIWPCLWSLTMVAFKVKLPPSRLFQEAIAFALGATLLHSTACVLNDICDVEFDRQVERTRNRPLAANRISVTSACILLLVMVMACVWLLTLLNKTSGVVGLLALFPFHALYPLMKRWTWWPQAWLGIAMNWGFPVAWLAILPRYSPVDVKIISVMLLGTVCWTIFYDTEYACQDRKDDQKAGIKSTALLFGDYVKESLMCFASAFLVALSVAGRLNGQGVAFYIISCLGTAVHLGWQLATWRVNDPGDCGSKFKSNGDLGYIIWAGLLLDYWLDIVSP